jgi:hypothetical protein
MGQDVSQEVYCQGQHVKWDAKN